jgi:two-component system NtrC family sensor kinase
MTGCVLIVDDSLTVRMDLHEAFRAGGFDAIPCASIAEARDALARGNVDAVVLDVLLPDGDGVEFLKELRAMPRYAATTIFMLSTEAEVKDRVRGLRTGADEYVGKPYDARNVVSRARQLLRERAPAGAGATTILVIDDSLTFRMELQRALEHEGYEVIAAATGEDGLRAAADRRPGAVIVDRVLPGIDGATVIRRIRLDAALRDVPCLLLTASADRDTELQALEAGADALVRKEEDVTVVLAKLAATLRQAAVGAPVDDRSSLHGPMKILAIDDSVTYLQAIGSSLRDEGYEVVLANSGEEALELLAAQAVDCILLDLIMPGLDGRQTCLRIKAVPAVRDIPLIMMTAIDDIDSMLDGLGAGADDYIRKSDEPEILRARVRAQIRRKQFQDENRRIREELLHRKLEAAESRAARELAQTRAVLVEELEWKNKELESFNYSVSHDLRGPLNIIDGFSAALLEDYAAVLDATAQSWVQHIRTGVARMTELTGALLQLSQASRGELIRERVDISAIAREVVDGLRLAEPGRAVALAIEDNLAADADAGLIRVLLENLLGNAWKFTRRTETPLITVGSRDGDHGATTYFVRDNGAGFTMDSTDALFRPFGRLHTEQEFPGTGIGLATVRRIVDRHGGQIRAEGKVGSGATFYFTF